MLINAEAKLNYVYSYSLTCLRERNHRAPQITIKTIAAQNINVSICSADMAISSNIFSSKMHCRMSLKVKFLSRNDGDIVIIRLRYITIRVITNLLLWTISYCLTWTIEEREGVKELGGKPSIPPVPPGDDSTELFVLSLAHTHGWKIEHFVAGPSEIETCRVNLTVIEIPFFSLKPCKSAYEWGMRVFEWIGLI